MTEILHSIRGSRASDIHQNDSAWIRKNQSYFMFFGKLAREAIPSLQNVHFFPPSLHAIIPVFQECLFLDQVQEPPPEAHVLLPRPGLPASSNTPLQTVLPPLPINCFYLSQRAPSTPQLTCGAAPSHSRVLWSWWPVPSLPVDFCESATFPWTPTSLSSRVFLSWALYFLPHPEGGHFLK